MKSNKKIINVLMILFLVFFGFQTFVSAETLSCDSWGQVRQDLQNIFNFMKILIPILIIGLSSYDFIKAVTAKDDKDIKKAFQSLLKRFACAVVFFFLPILLNLILDLFGTNSSICVE